MNIITAAYNYSSKNKPGTIATEATELLQLVIRRLRRLYALAPRINYTYFAGFAEVDANAESGGPEDEGWERPQEAESVFRIERTSHTVGGQGKPRDEVKIVGYDDVKAEEGYGCVFRMGQTYFSAGNPLDPTGGQLRIFFSRRPTDPTTVNDPLDVQWTEQFNDLLILDVAAYLAAKDGRDAEAASLRAERKEWLQQFVMFLEHCEANEVRRLANVRRFNTNTLVPLTTFLPAAG
jgi:hypothetical protein